MRVFKFGGASVKDAESVKNVVNVLREVEYDDTLLVVSAMGKMTNAMETVIDSYFDDKKKLASALQEVIKYHNEILLELFENDGHPVFKQIKLLFEEVQGFLVWNKSPKYNFVYDQVIGYGELVSTSILSAYLNEVGIANTGWMWLR